MCAPPKFGVLAYLRKDRVPKSQAGEGSRGPGEVTQGVVTDRAGGSMRGLKDGVFSEYEYVKWDINTKGTWDKQRYNLPSTRSGHEVFSVLDLDSRVGPERG